MKTLVFEMRLKKCNLGPQPTPDVTGITINSNEVTFKHMG